MGRIDAVDYARVGKFIAETADLPVDDEPFSPSFLAALRGLVPCDDVAFAELDRVRRIELGVVRDPVLPGPEPEPELTYWEIRHEHPTCHVHDTTGDFRAYRLTDFVTHRALRRSRIYLHWFRPLGVEHQLTVGLDAPLWHTKVFLFSRASGRDFTRRDCDVLDTLRPHLAARYALSRVALHGNPIGVRAAAELTLRELDVLDLVTEGLTNGEIAQRLWISPGTVRRHLENIYEKLDVHTRTAAVARVHGPG